MNQSYTNHSKVLVAYHDNCIDGFTAAWACMKGLIETRNIQQENISSIAMTYGKYKDFIDLALHVDKVYVVDFSIPVDVLQALHEEGVAVTVIDHHKTAAEMYGISDQIAQRTVAGADIVYDVHESGASLVWRYFYQEVMGEDYAVPKLVQYVKDYDLWQFKLPYTKAINKYLRAVIKTFDRWEALYLSFKTIYDVESMIDTGLAIQSYHDFIVEGIVATAEPITIDGEEGLVANCSPDFASDVGHILATKSGTFGATWQQVQDKVKYSLRSNGNYDVARLAQIFGGGGHKNAAGFTFNNPTVSEKEGITLFSVEETDGENCEGEYRGG